MYLTFWRDLKTSSSLVSLFLWQEKGRTSETEVLPMCKTGSPICNIDRTFTHIFFLKPKISRSKSVNHFYQNPVCLARQYRSMIDSGEVENQTDLAQKLAISKVRACQVLSLLQLNSELLDAIDRIGNPMPTRLVTERILRECLKSPEMYKSILSRLSNFKK